MNDKRILVEIPEPDLRDILIQRLKVDHEITRKVDAKVDAKIARMLTHVLRAMGVSVSE